MGSLLGAAVGGGKYSVPDYTINQQDFQNPVGNQAGNWQQGMSNMLGATTGSAPVGSAAQAGGAQLNSGQYNQTFGQEQGLVGQYGQMAAGQGPSVAQNTANAQSQQGLNATLAALGSQSGASNPALAQRAAIDAGANAQAQATAGAIQGRTQEELAAMGAQTSLLGAMNNQATNFAGANANLAQGNNQFNAGQNNQMTLANLNNALQNKQINAQQYDQYMNLLQAQNMAQFNANQNYSQLGLQQLLCSSQINSQAQQNYQQQLGQGFNQLTSALASAFSDINAKTKITKAETELDMFLSHINKIIKERK